MHIREFVDVEIFIERIMYVYQYANAFNQFVFRYDNTGHHKKLGLATYPHHKHEGSEKNVIASNSQTLPEVFQEIELLVKIE